MAQLGTTFECLDDLSGLPSRYVGKLLAPAPVRGLSRHSMGPLLASLGLRLNVVVDEQALQKIRHRLTPSRWPEGRKRAHARRRALTRETPVNPSRVQFKGNRDWALQMHAKAMAATTPEFRRARASLAAKAGNAKRRRLREAAEAIHAG